MPLPATNPGAALQVLRGTDVPIEPLMGCEVALLGYGNQGRSHALNLRDAGIRVRVGARPAGRGWQRATDDGFAVRTLADAANGAHLVILALPDEHHAAVWRTELHAVITPGQTLGLLHGLSVHFGLLAVPAGVGCVLVAPKGPGSTLRARFVEGRGIPALVAVHQDVRAHSGAHATGATVGARDLALAWAAGIGCGRAGVIMTTFRDEAVTDLFGEQAVLCGGMLGLARAAYDTLVARGYPPLLAYIECVHEIKQVADLLYERGPAGMCRAISNTAEFGAYEAAPAIADEHLRARLDGMLNDIQSGAFATRLAADADAGAPGLTAHRTAAAAHGWEAAGRDARALMPWLQDADKGPQ